MTRIHCDVGIRVFLVLALDGLIQGRYVCSEKLESKHRELLNEDVYYKLWYQRVKLGKY